MAKKASSWGEFSPKAKDTIKKLIDKYERESEVCMAEFLADQRPKGLTYEEALEVYVGCMKAVEGDKFYTIKEGERIEL